MNKGKYVEKRLHKIINELEARGVIDIEKKNMFFKKVPLKYFKGKLAYKDWIPSEFELTHNKEKI